MKTKILMLFVLCCLFFGCRTVQQTTESDVYKDNKEVVKDFKRDSLFVYKHDSVFMLVKGDTVMIEKYRYLYQYRDVLKTDTLIKSDSIYLDKKTVEKQGLSKWESFWIVLGRILLIAVMAYILIRVVVWKLKH